MVNIEMLKVKYTRGGFFSYCSVRLTEILQYTNTHKTLPIFVDSSAQFDMYRPENIEGDVTYHFFTSNDMIIPYAGKIRQCYDNQFKRYKELMFDQISPFISKYFSVTPEISEIANNLIRKYKLTPPNTIAVYYRGTDKGSETQLGSFTDYKIKLQELRTTERLLIQTDSAGFLESMSNTEFTRIEENAVSYGEQGIHLQNTPTTNYVAIKYFLATILIMARCKSIICSSGNCSLWLMYYRGNARNVWQNLNNEWF
jgi:hypothetical protein